MAHDKTKEEVIEYYQSNAQVGLTCEQVVQRQKEYGKNSFIVHKNKSLWTMIKDQISDPMIIILVIGVLLSAILKEYLDAGVILFVIMFNTLIGVIQQFKAEKTMEALRKLSDPKTKVKRDGIIQEIPSEDLVIGDLVLLEAGKYVSCDLRILKCYQLQVDESSLTGESETIEKNDTYVYQPTTMIADRKNIVYASTFVTNGKAEGIVIAIGMQTEVGKIANLIHETKEELTPLQKRFQLLGNWLGMIAVFICILLLSIGIYQKREIMNLLITAISLAVAVIPEGLPTVVTIVLALGVRRMSQMKAIVRKMYAVETLGSIDTICSDKTGTLTQNQMTVVEVACPFSNMGASNHLLEGMCLCNDCYEKEQTIQGNPTEVALIHYGKTFQIDKNYLEQMYPRVFDLPFDSARKRMTVVNKRKNVYEVNMKGALDSVLPFCTKIEKNGIVMPLSDHDCEKIDETAQKMGKQALRVLALARKEMLTFDESQVEEGLIFIGMMGMIDPPKEEVAAAITQAKQAGIQTIMITGDHPSTAFAIAKQLQLLEQENQVITGKELDQITDQQLLKRLEYIKVYARVHPNHKARIVKAYKELGKIVAMTGDGINDAPALKQADVGIAMGMKGTDVCKESSDLILTDDNYGTIIVAIEEGRTIYTNIQKTILYLLSCNIGEIFALVTAVLLLPSYPIPLSAIQILWVNVITDSFPAFALGVEPKENDVMRQPPRDKHSSLFPKHDTYLLVINGLLIGTFTIISFRYGLNYSIEIAHTMAFMTLSFTQLIHAFNFRSLHDSIFKAGIFKNKALTFVVFFSIFFQMLLSKIPFFQPLLDVVSLPVYGWILVFALSLMMIFINEGVKLFSTTEN
ncbi:MAG: calcium-translocating P-type ATPase, PMCA-type [Erysipelotrichaceae bacterium]|nr:calcium-translocating P-type ATPase, PMCA-type [Erysipelotrichaceae bacterium]